MITKSKTRSRNKSPGIRPQAHALRIRPRMRASLKAPEAPLDDCLPDATLPAEVAPLVPPRLREPMARFFGMLCAGARHADALRAAHIGWRTVSRLLCHDALDAYYRSCMIHRDRITQMRCDDELERRAFDGVKRPVYFNGKKVGDAVEYPHEPLMEVARSAAPERYMPRLRSEISGPRGAPVPMQIVAAPAQADSVEAWEADVARARAKDT